MHNRKAGGEKDLEGGGDFIVAGGGECGLGAFKEYTSFWKWRKTPKKNIQS